MGNKDTGPAQFSHSVVSDSVRGGGYKMNKVTSQPLLTLQSRKEVKSFHGQRFLSICYAPDTVFGT